VKEHDLSGAFWWALIALILAAGFSSGCSHKKPLPRHLKQPTQVVKFYSGGQLIRSWVAKGRVSWYGANSFCFYDKETGNYIRVSGDVVVTHE